MQLVVNDEAVLTLDLYPLQMEPVSDDRFLEFSELNPEYRIERTAQGSIVVMPGAGGKTGNRNLRLNTQLGIWTDGDGRGVAFDSSTLFLLPNTAMRSPDASWVLRSSLAKLTAAQKEKYLPLCPDFVVELTSPSDRLSSVREKMQECISNGCSLGWLIDVKNCRVHIYRPSGMEIVESPQLLTAGEPVQGFELQLNAFWNPDW